MTDNSLHKTDVTISTTADNCATARLETSQGTHFCTNISLKSANPLRTSAGQKEVSVRITSKSRISKLNDINTF